MAQSDSRWRPGMVKNYGRKKASPKVVELKKAVAKPSYSLSPLKTATDKSPIHLALATRVPTQAQAMAVRHRVSGYGNRMGAKPAQHASRAAARGIITSPIALASNPVDLRRNLKRM